MKRVVVLGSTGSIGQQALEVCRLRGYEVVGVAAGKVAPRGSTIRHEKRITSKGRITVHQDGQDLFAQRIATAPVQGAPQPDRQFNRQDAQQGGQRIQEGAGAGDCPHRVADREAPQQHDQQQ